MAFSLQLLHINDQQTTSLAVLDDIPRAEAILKAFQGSGAGDVTLTLSAGDTYLPGLFFAASGDLYGHPGIADIQINNLLGIQANAIGNHEFDDGTETFASLISGLDDEGESIWDPAPYATYSTPFNGTNFPYLSANLSFPADSEPLLNALVQSSGQSPVAATIASSVVFEENGERIGVVGATTPGLASITSAGGTLVTPAADNQNLSEEEIDALAAVIQPEVDGLVADGVDKIILTSHGQVFRVEEGLAKRLKNVDIVIAGGSEVRTFDGSDRPRPGDTQADTYPKFVTNAGGTQTAVVTEPGDYRYIGRLVIDFDDDGNLIPSSYDSQVSGSYATDAAGVEEVGAEVDPDSGISQIVNDARSQITQNAFTAYGYSDVYLNGYNRSGTGKASDPDGIRTQETNAGNLTADANLDYARSFDDSVLVSIKNGGGIRNAIGSIDENGVRRPNAASSDEELGASLPAGAITRNDIRAVLAFNNGLRLLTLTAEELHGVLDYMVGAIDDVDGRFPHVSGVKFSFDPDAKDGKRINDAYVHNADGEVLINLVENGKLVADADQEIRIVSLDFLTNARFDENGNYANAGDGIPFPNIEDKALRRRLDVVNLNAVDLGEDVTADFRSGTEQDALAEFLLTNHGTADTAYRQGDLGPNKDGRMANLSYNNIIVKAPSNPSTSIDLGGAEILDFSERGRFAAVTGGDEELRIVGYNKNLAKPKILLRKELSGEAQSVAVKGNRIAIAVSDDKTEQGSVQIFRWNPSNEKLKLTDSVTVGFLPDAIAWKDDVVVIANEGEPNDFYGVEDGVDPIGSISVLTMDGGKVAENDEITASDSGFTRKGLRQAGVRLDGLKGSSIDQLLEPEFVNIDPSGDFATVTLQENNAMARVDLDAKKIVSITGLGRKNWGRGGLVVDTSNEDGPDGEELYNPGPRQFKSLYMADGMDSFIDRNGETFVVMANEGDGRIRPDDVNFEAEADGKFSFSTKNRGSFTSVEDGLTGRTLYVHEGTRGGNSVNFAAEEGDEFFLTMKYGAVADDDYFADEVRAKKADDFGFAGDNLITYEDKGEGRLKLLTDQIGKNNLVAMGGRSFSIRNTAGDLVWDSGDQLDRIAAAAGTYDDGRSDDKGIEPEHVEIATLKNRSFAFITFERSSGGSLIPVYEITDVTAPEHVHTFLAPDSDEPESTRFVNTSNRGGVLLAASEDSGTVDTFGFNLNMF